MQESSAVEWVDEARRRMNQGDLSAARRLLSQALPGISEEHEALAAAGILLLRLGSVSAAVSCVRRSANIKPDSETGASAAFNVLWPAGYQSEALEHLTRWAHHDTSNVERVLHAISQFSSVGLESQASEFVELGLRRFPDSSGSFLEAGLQLLSDSAVFEAAPRRLERLGKISEAHLAIATDWAMDLGVFDFVEEALADLPEQGSWPIRAKDALWRVDREAFEYFTARVEVSEGESALFASERARMLCLQGDWATGVSALRQCDSSDENDVWIAEGLRKMGQFEEANEILGKLGERRGGGLPVTARLNQLLLEFDLEDLDGQFELVPEPYQELVESLTPLFPGWDGMWNGKVRFLRSLFEAALELCGGNRSEHPTFVSREGKLHAFNDLLLKRKNRFEWVMRRLFVNSFDEMDRELAHFEDYLPARQARAELSIRHGRFEEAHARLEALGNSANRNLWLELALLEGNVSRAVELSRERGAAAILKAQALWVAGEGEAFRAALKQIEQEKTKSSMRYGLLKAAASIQPERELADVNERFPVASSIVRPGKTRDETLHCIRDGLLKLTTGAILSIESIRAEHPPLLAVLDHRAEYTTGPEKTPN